MGASPLMSLGMRAMAANYAALQTTGHNIANANVVGFSRQEAQLSTSQGQFTGAGFFGKGVQVDTVSRAHDVFLTREAVASRSFAAADAARLDRLRALEEVFRPGEDGIGSATGQFLNAMSDLASRPGDAATRQVVLGRAQEMAARFSDASAQLDGLQRNVDEGLRAGVADVNALAAGIARVNAQIAGMQGLSQPPNDLLDERDRLIGRLAEQIQITTVPADDGTIGVFFAGGQRLVLGAEAQTLVVTADPEDPSRAAIGLSEFGITRVIDENRIGAGNLAGILRFQNDDLVDARNQLGQLAAAVAWAVNTQQELGMNLHLPAGSVTPLPMFEIGDPEAIPGPNNARNGSGVLLAGVTIGIDDASQLRASDYRVVADPPGQVDRWRVTPLIGGTESYLERDLLTGVLAGTVDGMDIQITGTPSASDTFLLKPVAAASQLTALLRDPRDLAAASRLTATVGGANTGSVGVGLLTVTSPAADPQNTATITFTNGTGAYAWELRDRTTNALVNSGTGTWTPGQTLPPAGGGDINGFSLRLSGMPAAGDTIAVSRTLHPASNNGNALALAALRDSPLVGRVLVGGVPSGGATATDAYAAAMADVGVRVQTAGTAAGISETASRQAETARASQAGVNLDEEAARLLQFQQSYQAAAKVLQVAQSIFDTLLQTAGGR